LSVAGSLPRHAAGVAAATVVVAAVAALITRALDADGARELLGLRFAPPAREPGEALQIAATNVRYVAAPLVAAWAVTSTPCPRLPLDVTLALVFVLNVAAVGVALGAYGPRALHSIAAHWPPELAAFAVAGGAYLGARRGRRAGRSLIPVALLALALVALGAVLETYAQIGGTR
jgi:hypothetical protein